ncbi:unnamed protein product, partial [Sphacelaria rigidula]
LHCDELRLFRYCLSVLLKRCSASLLFHSASSRHDAHDFLPFSLSLQVLHVVCKSVVHDQVKPRLQETPDKWCALLHPLGTLPFRPRARSLIISSPDKKNNKNRRGRRHPFLRRKVTEGSTSICHARTNVSLRCGRISFVQ